MRKLLRRLMLVSAVMMVLPAAQCASVVETPDQLEANSDNLEANLETLKRTNACPNCYLQGAYLYGANLQKADFRGADLRGADLRRANLQGTDLKGANLRRANLQGADLKGASLYNAELGKANLHLANLEGATLEGAGLQLAELQGANLQGANLQKANLQKANLQGAHLRGAKLEGADLHGTYFWGAELQGANLFGANLFLAILVGADLEGANLVGAHLRIANLAGANLGRANLQDANLVGAHLEGANLEGANLLGAKLDSDDLAMAKAQGAILDASGSDVAKAVPEKPKPVKRVAQQLGTSGETKEIARLKREAVEAKKEIAAARARTAELARLEREAEQSRKAALAGGDKVRAAESARLKEEAKKNRKTRAAEMARLEKEVEQRHWDSVKDSPELAAVQDYLKRYPKGRYAAEAKAHLAVLQRLASANKIDFGNYHALVIGINNYKHLPKLQMAVNDAKAVAKVLKEGYGFKVTLQTDPDHGEIMDAFDEFQETLTDKDNLLIYYAGHGWLNEEVDRGYWLPANAKPKRRRHWISNAVITDTLKGLSAKHVMVVADSCYSGTLIRAADVGSRKKGGDYWKEMAAKWARVAITSGGLEPVADKGGGENSPFAKAFIDTLKDNRSVMDGTTLFGKMRRSVMVAAEQTPQYSDVRGAGHDGGDFLFVRKK